MRITELADVQPRPRRVAVGEFDGVHLGHRRVIEGSDTVLTFEPHPLQVVRPEAAPKLLTSLAVKAELIESARRRRAGRDPVRPRLRRARRPRSSSTTCWCNGCRRPGCRSARTSASATAPPATPTCSRADRRFETRIVPLVEVDGEIVSSSHIRGLVLAGDVGAGHEVPGVPVPAARRGRARRSARARAGLPDRQHRPRRGPGVPGPRRLRGARRRRLRGGQRRRAPDVRDRPGGAGRGLPARPRHRPVREDPEDRLSGPAARRAAVRLGRRADRADAARRRADAASCADRRSARPATPACYAQRPHDAHPGTQAGARHPVRRRRDRHRQGRGPDRADDRADQRPQPSTCALTARTTIRAAGC